MNANLKRLVAIGALTSITEIYSSIFFTARMYELARNSIQTISNYYIVEYFCIMLTFLLLGSKIKAYPLKALRIGIMLNLILLCIIMLLDDNVMQYYILFAAVQGIAMGAYYSPFAVLIVFPVTIGFYIKTTSFISMTSCIIVVSVIQVVLSMRIENVVMKEAKCDVRHFMKSLKRANSAKKVLNYYKISFFSGIVSSVLDRTVLLLIMIVFGSSVQLGILNTVFAVFTICTTWTIKKYYNGKKSKVIIAVSVLFVNTNTNTVIFYKVINSVFICILSMMTNIERYACLGKELNKQFTAEHQIMAEITLGLGRVFGLSVLLIMNTLIGGLYAIMIMLIFISFSIIAYAWLIAKQ